MAGDKDSIQLFVPTYEIDECLAQIRETLEIGWTGLGFKTVQFEKDWQAYTGMPHAHFVNSATVGLQLALAVMKETYGWKADDEVISTPLTFVSTNHVILHEGLKPVFADIDDTLCLDPESVEARITKRTRALIFVGIGGNAGRLAEIQEICRRRNVKLILDAAHMAGTKYHGNHVGGGIDCTVFSFQAVKNLPTGDAGMICFADEEFDKKVRLFTWLGINKDTYARFNTTDGAYKWHYNVEHVGFKAHGNSVMAAIGIVQLKYLDRDNQRRREMCEKYDQLLMAASGIDRIEHLGDCQSSRHLFQVRVADSVRDPLIAAMHEQKIYPGVHYRANTRYPMYAYAFGTCPKAEQRDLELVSLPLHLRLTTADQERVVTALRTFVANQQKHRKAA